MDFNFYPMFCQECGQKFSEQDNACPKCGWYPEQKPDISKAQSSTSGEESFSSLDYDRSVKLSALIKRYELFSVFSSNLDHKGCIMPFISLGCLGYCFYEHTILTIIFVVYLVVCLIKAEHHLKAARKLLDNHNISEAEEEYKKSKPFFNQLFIFLIIMYFVPVFVFFKYCVVPFYQIAN